MGGASFATLQQKGVFSELAILFPSEAEVRELLAGLGAERGDLVRLPTVGNMPPSLYWRRICELIDNGMFAGFGLDELVAAAHQRFPGNQVLRELTDGASAAGRELAVLCLQAGPTTLNQLQLRQEHAVLRQIAARRGQRLLTVKTNPATRRDDIMAEILAARPDVVHFAGHGTSDGKLLFEEGRGQAGPVTVDALASVLRVLPASLPCLVLGSCFGASYAGRLLGAARSVAGSMTALPDPAAIEFTRGFYTALAIGGTSVAKAFDAGLAQMQVHGHDTTDMRFEHVPEDHT